MYEFTESGNIAGTSDFRFVYYPRIYLWSFYESWEFPRDWGIPTRESTVK